MAAALRCRPCLQRATSSALSPIAISHTRYYRTPPNNRAPKPEISPLSDAQQAARVASTPHEVRERRERQHVPEVILPSGLTAVQKIAYEKRKARGDLLRDDGTELPEAAWLEAMNTRRTRIRGIRKAPAEDSENGDVDYQVVGHKVYLPNIIFRMLPNNTPNGKPYNPYEATFRIPQSVTKTDVRSYLHGIYGVECTYIRTDNHIAPISRKAGLPKARHDSRATYKRAIVGLKEPFYFPLMVEDMSAEDRTTREKELNEGFETDRLKKEKEKLWATQLGIDKGWGNRLRGKKNIMRARKTRAEEEESKVQDAVKEMMASAQAIKPDFSYYYKK